MNDDQTSQHDPLPVRLDSTLRATLHSVGSATGVTADATGDVESASARAAELDATLSRLLSDLIGQTHPRGRMTVAAQQLSGEMRDHEKRIERDIIKPRQVECERRVRIATEKLEQLKQAIARDRDRVRAHGRAAEKAGEIDGQLQVLRQHWETWSEGIEIFDWWVQQEIGW